ncbi:hypothetical protein F5Y18DRAFT_379835 [Xylariaceae sp. FL1019]|nr:hypothetical protein F5Y18DRAFT_379835 [Xylariaceae sp. FL1019]
METKVGAVLEWDKALRSQLSYNTVSPFLQDRDTGTKPPPSRESLSEGLLRHVKERNIGRALRFIITRIDLLQQITQSYSVEIVPSKSLSSPLPYIDDTDQVLPASQPSIMHSASLLSIFFLISSAYTAQVLLYATSPVCRSTSVTLRMNVPAGPGCVPIPGTDLYTAGRLGQAGPEFRLRIYSYQGANRCAGELGEGSGADSCVTDVGQSRIISGVGVADVSLRTEEGDAVAEALDDAHTVGVVAYGFADGKTLHEIHRDSEHAAGYLKLKTDQERSDYIIEHADYRRPWEGLPVDEAGDDEL